MKLNGKPRLSVFKGREARLNRMVLLILGQEGQLSIRQVYKKARAFKGLGHVRYRVVNRRMKALEREGYIELAEARKVQQGFTAKHYQPTTKAYLALALETADFEAVLRSEKEQELTTLLATIMDIAMRVRQS
ncbi:MAG: hypothetical protein QXR42_06335 [Candidatus Bathyarchaeia archaeon]